MARESRLRSDCFNSKRHMEFEIFLRETALLLGLQPRPFQRRGIKRKIERRILESGARDFEDYLLRIRKDRQEQENLSRILSVTISRFFRDREVFDIIESSIIPPLAGKRSGRKIQAWSIGCASGEEPYSLSLLWKERFEERYPRVGFSILATEIDEILLQRAEERRYKKSSLREVQPEILDKYFKEDGEYYILDPSIRQNIEFRRHDILREDGASGMDMVLCRNVAFTYFARASQVNVLNRIARSLEEDGCLVIGMGESLPLHDPALFVPAFPKQNIYRKFG